MWNSFWISIILALLKQSMTLHHCLIFLWKGTLNSIDSPEGHIGIVSVHPCACVHQLWFLKTTARIFLILGMMIDPYTKERCPSFLYFWRYWRWLPKKQTGGSWVCQSLVSQIHWSRHFPPTVYTIHCIHAVGTNPRWPPKWLIYVPHITVFHLVSTFASHFKAVTGNCMCCFPWSN